MCKALWPSLRPCQPPVRIAFRGTLNGSGFGRPSGWGSPSPLIRCAGLSLALSRGLGPRLPFCAERALASAGLGFSGAKPVVWALGTPAFACAGLGGLARLLPLPRLPLPACLRPPLRGGWDRLLLLLFRLRFVPRGSIPARLMASPGPLREV